MHVWYVDADIEDTPEPVYTHYLVLSCLVTVVMETKLCRYNWHSAGSLGWPFPMMKC